MLTRGGDPSERPLAAGAPEGHLHVCVRGIGGLRLRREWSRDVVCSSSAGDEVGGYSPLCRRSSPDDDWPQRRSGQRHCVPLRSMSGDRPLGDPVRIRAWTDGVIRLEALEDGVEVETPLPPVLERHIAPPHGP